MPTVWNSADKGTSITLSSTDHVATGSSGNGKVRATTSHASGKWYLEYPVNVVPSGSGIIGFGAASVDLNNSTLGDGLGVDPGGNLQTSVGSQNIALLPDGVALSFAIDFDNLRVWARGDGGDWNADPGADPATNTGGIPFVILAAYFPMVFIQNAGNNTINAGDSAFVYAVPAGFVGWDQPPPDPEEFFGVVIS